MGDNSRQKVLPPVPGRAVLPVQNNPADRPVNVVDMAGAGETPAARLIRLQSQNARGNRQAVRGAVAGAMQAQSDNARGNLSAVARYLQALHDHAAALAAPQPNPGTGLPTVGAPPGAPPGQWRGPMTDAQMDAARRAHPVWAGQLDRPNGLPPEGPGVVVADQPVGTRGQVGGMNVEVGPNEGSGNAYRVVSGDTPGLVHPEPAPSHMDTAMRAVQHGAGFALSPGGYMLAALLDHRLMQPRPTPGSEPRQVAVPPSQGNQ